MFDSSHFELARPIEPEVIAVPSIAPGPYVNLDSQESAAVASWRILRRRKWTVILVPLCTVILVVLASLKMTPIYRATGRIAISKENDDSLGIDNESKASNSVESASWDLGSELDTQARILQSDTLALRVIHDLRLDKNPVFANPGRSLFGLGAVRELDPVAAEAALLKKFQKSLLVSKIPRTRVINIGFESSDPKLAAATVNALSALYVEQNFKAKFESTVQASDWLSRQLSDLQLKVESSQAALVRYQKEKGILGIDEKQNITTAKLNEINAQLTQAQADRIARQASYELTQSGKLDELPELSGNVLIQQLRQSESDISKDYAEANTLFGPSYPKVTQLRNQLNQIHADIDAETQRIAARIRNDYVTAQNREDLLRRALEDQKVDANQLNESAIEYDQLKREADTNRQLYDSLLEKLKEASVVAGLHSSNVRVIDAARQPAKPDRPDIPLNLAMGFLLGAVGGVAGAFLLEAADNKVRTPEQMEQAAALPTLGIVPELPEQLRATGETAALLGPNAPQDSAAMISYTRPKSQIAESYRALRTSILLASLGGQPKVIVLTSGLPQEGKTTTSINTAIVLAQNGKRVLLVDADLRRPSVHRALRMRNLQGVSTVISSGEAVEGSIVPSLIPNLDVLPAGPVPPHPAELVGSNQMRQLLQQLRSRYDHIVIDTPPVLSVTDAVMLSVQADVVVLVVRSGILTKHALRRTRQMLQQVGARVLGLVVNAFDYKASDTYYYYYGSKYAGKYYTEDETVAQNQ